MHSSNSGTIHRPDSQATGESQSSGMVLPASGGGYREREPGAMGYLGPARLGCGRGMRIANAVLCCVPACCFGSLYVGAAGATPA